jgi:protein phosphatase
MASHPEADTGEYPSSETGEFPSPAALEPPSPFSSLVRVDVAGLSHPGRVRPANEDHFLIARLGRYFDVTQTNLPPGDVPARSEEVAHGLAVADGMGGVKGGAEASRLALRTLVNLVLRRPDWILRLDDKRAKEVMRRAAQRHRQIDAAIAARAEGDPELSWMGTTMTVACSLGADLFVVHVGDSRAYLLRGGRLRQLTRDHTLVQALVDAGELTREEAASHHLRHVLVQALGRQDGDLAVEVQRFGLADGDCVLLCTDGLTEMVPDARVAEVLGRPGSAEDACRALVGLALGAGGKDNVTAVVARYRLPGGPAPA